jgi:tetratricopeptide (TPR) repeat protein
MSSGAMIPVILLGIWVFIMLFGIVGIIDPPWMKALSKPGIATEALTYADWGDQRVREHDFEGALDWYQRALRIDPKHLMARVNGAIACGQLGRFDQGLELLRGALAESPNQQGVILYNMAELVRRKGNHDEAIHLYEQALEKGGRPELIHARLGDEHAARNDLARAHDAFEAALREWEDPANHYRNMLLQTRETNAKDSTQVRPIDAALARGITEADLARYDCDFLRGQIGRDPELGRILGRLGEIEWKLGDPVHARTHLERCLAIAPQSAQAAGYREIIASLPSGR